MTELIEVAATRLLHCATAALPADVSAVLLASSRFLECSLCTLEHACADSLGAQRPALLHLARRALAAILALTADAAPDAALLSAALAARPAGVATPPRFDELLASPPLQTATLGLCG